MTFRGDRVYVASGESGTLRVHRVDGLELRRTAVPEDSYNVQQAHGWVITPASAGARSASSMTAGECSVA